MIAACMKAVVAICVVLVPADAVGAAGVPVKVGLAIGAPPKKDNKLSQPVETEFGLFVFASIVLKYILELSSLISMLPFGYPPMDVAKEES